MSDLYRDSHRGLQNQFDTRRMADRLKKMIIAEAIADQDRGFIESHEMLQKGEGWARDSIGVRRRVLDLRA